MTTPTHQEKELREAWRKSSIYSYLKKWNKDDELAMEALDTSIADWWLSKRSQDLARLKGEVEAKMSDAGFEELNGREYTQGYDDGLSAVLEVIEKHQ